MRPRVLIPVLACALVVLAGLFYFRRSTVPADLKSASENTMTPLKSGLSPSQPQAKTASNQPVSSTASVVASPSTSPLQREADSRNTAVDFYGQVIDQDSNALSDVHIKAVVLHVTAVEPMQDLGTRDVTIERTTGTDGRFHLDGVTGDVFELEPVQKDGYEPERGPHTFAAVGGSWDNPNVFKMWSTNIHEQLISGKSTFTIVPDGRSYLIDLANGTISEGGSGDIKVWVKRPQQIVYGQHYDWSCGIDLPSGGLLEEQDLSSPMFQAPLNGYTNSFMFDEKIGSGWGDGTGVKRFYLALNKGQEYGRVSIELYAYYDSQTPGLIRLSYTLNPSGSRILR